MSKCGVVFVYWSFADRSVFFFSQFKTMAIMTRSTVHKLYLLGIYASTARASVYDNQTQTYGCNIGSFYTINMNEVYSLNSKMPQGCKCEKQSSLDTECVDFDCDCTCDLTAGACDYNCCCDPDCSASEILRFEESDYGCILKENEPEFQQCYDADRVNERYNMEYAGTSKQSIDELLCVESNNADVKGTFFNDPGDYEGDTSIFSESNGEKEFSYKEVIPGDSAERGSDSVYYRGDAMRAATSSSSRSAFGGYLPLFVGGSDGTCLESNYAHFMEPIRDNKCYRYIDDLETSCHNELSVSRFSSLSVCASYETSFAACSNFIEVEVGTVKYRDLDLDSEEYELSDDSTISTLYSLEANRCVNALIESCFYIYYTTSGAISKVLVDFTVTNISSYTTPTSVTTYSPTPMPTYTVVPTPVPTNTPAPTTNASQPSSTPTTAPVSSTTTSTSSAFMLQQKYSLEFVRAGTAINRDAVNEGNTVLRGRSGNPGYIIGKPLLSAMAYYEGRGSASGGSAAMLAVIPGLQVYDASASPYCSNPSNTQTHVNFGEDVITGCMLSLTYQNFTNMCQSGYLLEDMEPMNSKVPYFLTFNTSFNYIGIFGNADPLDVSQWLEINLQVQSDVPSFDDNERTCDNLITSLHYEFLYAKVGSVFNPQNKIIGARAFYKTETIVFTAESGSNGGSSSQDIMLSTSISFIQFDQDKAHTYSPPPPPILLSVPYDIFYPFEVNGAIGGKHYFTGTSMVVALLVVAFNVFRLSNFL